MDVTRYGRILRRMWPVLVIATVLGAAAGWLTTSTAAAIVDAEPPTYYRARHLLLSTSIPRENEGAILQRAAFLARRGEVPLRVAEALGRGPIRDSEVHVRANETIGYLEITVVQDTEEETQRLANAYSRELGRYLRARTAGEEGVEFATVGLVTIERTPAAPISEAAYRDFLRSPALQLAGEQSGQRQQQQTSAESREAEEELPPEPQSRPQRAGIGGLIGLFAGAGLILGIDRVDTRIRTKEDAEGAFALPVLAEIPMARSRLKGPQGIAAHVRPDSAEAEAYRVLRSHLLFTAGGTGGNGGGGHPASHAHAEPHIVLISSPAPEQGKTTTTANLAAVLAEAGRAVLVLDCDFRRPRMQDLLRARSGSALADLAGEPAMADVDQLVRPTGLVHVSLVTSAAGAGTVSNPADMIARQRTLVGLVRDRFDVVLLDSAPLLAMSDASDLVPICDTAIVTALAGKTNAGQARRATELLARMEAPVAGVVLVGAEGAPTMSRSYLEVPEAADGKRRRGWRAVVQRDGRPTEGAGAGKKSPRRKSR